MIDPHDKDLTSERINISRDAIFQSFLDAAPDAMVVVGRDGQIVMANGESDKVFGYPREELLGKPIEVLVPERFRLAHPKYRNGYFKDLRTRPMGAGVDLFARKKDGKEFPAEISLSPVETERGRLVIAVVRDITERKRAEDKVRGKLAATEDRYRNLMTHALSGINILDLTGKILEINPSMANMLGRSESEIIGRHFGEFSDPSDLEATQKDFGRLAEEGKVVTRNVKLVHPSRSVIYADFSANVITIGGKPTVLAIAHDVTERVQAEEQLRQSQKMEAVGLLSGGIAHDFNNMLAVILMHCDLLLKRSRDDDQSDALAIKQTAERAAALTRQLLIFSRKQIVSPKVVDPNSLLGELEKMLLRLIGENIRMDVRLNPKVSPVKIDPSQFDQIVMNLAVNARDAMPNGGSLVFELEEVEFRDVQSGNQVEAKPGRYVVLKVTDTGCGMNPETIAKIFEPFFTTKAAGRGTGLGLSTVLGIIKQSGGGISVSSEVGKGSQFKVFFPISEAKVERVVAAAVDVNKLSGSEMILVVEDEPDLRELTVLLLKDNGYIALGAKDGVQALALCTQYEGKIDLVMTDVLMPNMSGPEFVRRMMTSSSSKSKKTKALFLSGYAAENIQNEFLPNEEFHFLEKPYSSKVLLTKVREVLSS